MFYNLHTHKVSHESNVTAIVNQYPLELELSIPNFSIGIHPWYINNETFETELDIINNILNHQNCLALGECGLDKRIEIPMDLQLEVFERQIQLAQKHKKPVILHCVSAFDEVIAVKKKNNFEFPMVIHGFSKNMQVAQMLLNNGFYLSFGKYLLRNPELASVFLEVPNDKFLLETDTIEEGIKLVYQKASEIKNINIEKQVEENFKTIFKI